MKYFLFLDDIREIGKDINFEIIKNNSDIPIICAKSYEEFVSVINNNGLPECVSFDIDLCVEHYMEVGKNNPLYFLNKTDLPKSGFHCATYLVSFCKQNNLPFPKYYIHSANTIGAQKLRQTIEKLIHDNRQS